jgi:hypothetical protein
MQMTMSRKVVLGIIGTIVLGAVGSGVWELIFSPTFTWLGRGLLTLVTLGLDSVSDSIYVDVAKGHHERPSLIVYGFLVTLILVAPVFMAINSRQWRVRLRKQIKDRTLEELARESDSLARKQKFLIYAMILLSSFIYVRGLMYSYTNAAVTHFNQCLAIVLPYISAEEERRIQSEFARISSKQDYTALLGKIQLRAASANVQLPAFSIW